MTHFVLYVIVPKRIVESGKTEKYIDNVMEPYSENTEVPTYITKSALGVTREMMKVNRNDPAFAEKMEGKTIAEAYMAWAGDRLDKKGNAISNWNKKSIWDWFVIGGRWDGRITKKIKIDEDTTRHQKLEDNMLQMGEFLENYRLDPDGMICHSVVKNGRLYAPGRHGWFGTFSHRNKKGSDEELEAGWRKRFERMFNARRAKKDYVVSLDCHV